MSKAKLKDQIIYLENKLANKENELQKTLKSFGINIIKQTFTARALHKISGTSCYVTICK